MDEPSGSRHAVDHRGDTDPRDPPDAAPADPLTPRHIVVAGGDELARAVVTLRLRRAGRDVLERTTGEHAARVVLKDPHHAAVVLVGELPDTTPAAFAAWLRGAPATRQIPLAVVVPRHRAELAGPARAAGADAVMAFPLALHDLLECLDGLRPAIAVAA